MDDDVLLKAELEHIRAALARIEARQDKMNDRLIDLGHRLDLLHRAADEELNDCF